MSFDQHGVPAENKAPKHCKVNIWWKKMSTEWLAKPLPDTDNYISSLWHWHLQGCMGLSVPDFNNDFLVVEKIGPSQ